LNERYVTPQLIIATHEQMFREFEKRYGTTLPVVQGDSLLIGGRGGLYSVRGCSQPRDGRSPDSGRNSVVDAGANRVSGVEYEAAWRNVALFDEHTWGAHNSTEEPDLPFVKQQWATKREFALNADRHRARNWKRCCTLHRKRNGRTKQSRSTTQTPGRGLT